MNLYIMRHGIAWDQSDWNGPDSERPLTDEGIERTREVLKKLKKTGELAPDAIWSSPFIRARQTAEIAASIYGRELKIVDQLECGAHLNSLMRAFQKETLPERLLTVGHEPDCGELVAALIGNDEGNYAFKRAGVAHLQGDFKPASMKLLWHYSPKDVLGD